MIQVFRSLDSFRDYRLLLQNPLEPQSVGFVPTMGALHAGHGKLLEKSVNENDITLLSIYVNPTQFNDPKDFEKYPQTLNEDIQLAESLGVNGVFLPDYPMLYPDQYRYKILETELSQKWCGAYRPGHFEGVLSVVMKLFQIVKPHRAYFGEKDYQQLQLIEGMVKAFFMDIKVVPVPTMREPDGLALSSRNVRLTPENRKKAPLLYLTLISSPSAESAQEALSSFGFKVDYVEDWNHRRLAAAYLGDVRLIDNVELKKAGPL